MAVLVLIAALLSKEWVVYRIAGILAAATLPQSDRERALAVIRSVRVRTSKNNLHIKFSSAQFARKFYDMNSIYGGEILSTEESIEAGGSMAVPSNQAGDRPHAAGLEMPTEKDLEHFEESSRSRGSSSRLTGCAAVAGVCLAGCGVFLWNLINYGGSRGAQGADIAGAMVLTFALGILGIACLLMGFALWRWFGVYISSRTGYEREQENSWRNIKGGDEGRPQASTECVSTSPAEDAARRAQSSAAGDGASGDASGGVGPIPL